MRKLVLIACLIACVAVLTFVGAGFAFGANPSGAGQPSQQCLSTDAPSEPGHASAAPGSAFNEDPGGVAGAVYAGNGTPSLNGNRDKAISQYDVACFQVSQSSP